MLIKILFLISTIVISNITVIHGHRLRNHGLSKVTTQSLLRRNRYRCTRRFTPGNCLSPPSPVWTFDFQLQNCIERLGCVETSHSNRFRSYASCKSRCQPLVDLYTYILALQGNGTGTALAEEYAETNDDPQNHQNATILRSFDEDEEEAGDQPLIYKTVGNADDMEALRDVTPPDIDHVFRARNEQDNDADDLLHPPLY